MFTCVRCGKPPSKPATIRRTLHFARQGMTDSFGCEYIDPTDEPLTNHGRSLATEAASELAESAVGKKVRMIVTSPMFAAVSTAQIFSSRLNVPMRRHPCLKERQLGKLQKNIDVVLFANLMRRDYQPQGSTPLDEFEKETLSFVAECAASPLLGTDTLFITHAFRLVTLLSVINGWENKVIPICRPPEHCKIVSFGIGTGCKKCGSLIYEKMAA